MYSETMIKKRVKGINWHTAIFIGLFHLGAVAALFMSNWKPVLVAILLWWISASLGVGMGFHRLLTHRGYKTPKVVEYFLTLCGALALAWWGIRVMQFLRLAKAIKLVSVAQHADA